MNLATHHLIGVLGQLVLRDVIDILTAPEFAGSINLVSPSWATNVQVSLPLRISPPTLHSLPTCEGKILPALSTNQY